MVVRGRWEESHHRLAWGLVARYRPMMPLTKETRNRPVEIQMRPNFSFRSFGMMCRNTTASAARLTLEWAQTEMTGPQVKRHRFCRVLYGPERKMRNSARTPVNA